MTGAELIAAIGPAWAAVWIALLGLIVWLIARGRAAARNRDAAAQRIERRVAGIIRRPQQRELPSSEATHDDAGATDGAAGPTIRFGRRRSSETRGEERAPESGREGEKP